MVKLFFQSCFLLFSAFVFAQNSQEFSKQLTEKYLTKDVNTANNLKLVVVTYDGLRWQEVFRGADKLLEKKLKKDDKLDSALLARLTTGSYQEKRKALSPFLWTTVAENGIILGNADKGNSLYLANPYLISYPGYSELYTGNVNRKINRNSYPDNPDWNILDVLQKDSSYKNSMVVFSNWDAFPRILNTNRNNIPMFCHYTQNDTTNAATNTACIAGISTDFLHENPYSGEDTAVYLAAKNYIVKNHPKIALIGFDETDHFAHAGNFPAYIMAAFQCDQFVQDLWKTLQNDPFYKDQTILIITCDHGRGGTAGGAWKHHSSLYPAARNTWFAAIGPGVNVKGESKEIAINYHEQIAATILKLLGKDGINLNHKTAKPIKEVIKN